MALGQAFIEVHADTKPFARELGAELIKILQAAEKDVQKSASKVGETIADQAGKGVAKNRNKISKGIETALDGAVQQGVFSRFAKGIVDSIDDGLSGLPAELKIALGAALVAISPFLAAGITALVTTALIAGFAGLGLLVASQFQVVQDEFTQLGSELRTFFVTIGNVFVQPVLNAFDLIRKRTFAMEGWFQEVFAVSATFIEPLADAVASFVEGLLPGLLDTLRNIQPLTDDLVASARELGHAIGVALRLISGTDDAAEGLRVLTVALGTIIVSTALLIRTLTDVFGILFDISQLITDPQAFIIDQAMDDAAEAAKNAAGANGSYEQSLKNLIAPTDAEEKALKDANKALADYVSLMFSSRRSNIDFEQSLDDMIIELEKGKRSLDINTQAGRDNQLAILNAAEALIRQRDETIKLTGDTNKANATFETNRRRLEDAAVAAGISRKRFQELTGTILDVPSTVVITVPTGSIATAISRLNALIATAIRAGAAVAQASSGGPGGSGGGGSVAAHADGGVFSTPHIGLVAEAGPEAIIPLNNPQRASQIMAEAGLNDMMSPTVNVYVGNEQFRAYVATVANQEMAASARAMSYGTRGI